MTCEAVLSLRTRVSGGAAAEVVEAAAEVVEAAAAVVEAAVEVAVTPSSFAKMASSTLTAIVLPSWLRRDLVQPSTR